MKKWFFIIFIFILIIPALAIGYMKFKKPKQHPPPANPTHSATAAAPSPQPQQPSATLDTANIHGLINQERAKAKLKPLSVNDELYNSALAKCQDMQKNNYYTHVSPSGVDYTTFIKQSVPNAKITGENLGAGYTDEAQIIKDWMANDKHKVNILNPKFTAEAIAVCGDSNKKPGLIIVAHFIG